MIAMLLGTVMSREAQYDVVASWSRCTEDPMITSILFDSMAMLAAFRSCSFAPRFTLESLDHVEELAPNVEIMMVKIERRS